MAGKYAVDTSVSAAQSKAEIERSLQRYGASKFMSGWDNENAMIAFEYQSLRLRFILPLPDKMSDEFWKTDVRKTQRSESQAYEKWEQACRQRWRALNLVVRAKLEAVECGISTFEEEFLAYIVTGSGRTVGETIIPQIEQITKGTRSVFAGLLPEGKS